MKSQAKKNSNFVRFISNKAEAILFAAIVLTTVIYKYRILRDFGFNYTDSDQSIMWLGASDYAKGIFHEPRFYGQSYNTMLEALFSVPLLWFGIKTKIALPMITMILSLIPFFVLGGYTYNYKSKFSGLLIVSLPLIFPLEYDMINCLSRGFITGIFASTICIPAMFVKESKFLFFLAGMGVILGYSINPNAILFSIPCLFYILLTNQKNINFYIYTGLGVLLGSTIHLITQSFYWENSNYIVHSYSFQYSIKNLIYGLIHLKSYLNYVSPFFANGLIVIVFFVCSIIFFLGTKNYKAILAQVAMIVLLIFTLGVSKVHDGNESIYFPNARMFLSIPVFLAITLSFAKIPNIKMFYIAFAAIPAFLFFKLFHLPEKIAEHSNISTTVSVIPNTELEKNCSELRRIATKMNAEIVIISNHWYYDFYTYACACIDSFPKTLRPDYERRTWRLMEEEKTVYDRLIIIDVNRSLDTEFNFVEKIEGFQGCYLISKNVLPTISLLQKMKIPIRNFKKI